MLIACVKRGDKYGPEYVERLWAGIQRHFPAGHDGEFVCFTDEAVPGIQCEMLPNNLPGWWSKLGVFQLREPLIYFDLDVIVSGDLTPLLEWGGFGIVKDYWWTGFNSSVMKLTGNEYHVYEKFSPEEMQRCYMGDQEWITKQMPEGKTFPRAWFPSYKADRCHDRMPEGAMGVVFHGEPKPHQITSGWVPEYWN